MSNTQLTDEQVTKVWELAQKMNLANLPQHGDYEDIRQDIFLRAISTSRQAFIDANATNFEEAAKCVLNSALADELKHLATNQRAFENDMTPFSALETEDEDSKSAAFEPTDPKSTTSGYYPSQDKDWQEALFDIYEEVQIKVNKLPRKQRILARGLMRGDSYEQIGNRLHKGRTTLFRMREELKGPFASTWVKRCALSQQRD